MEVFPTVHRRMAAFDITVSLAVVISPEYWEAYFCTKVLSPSSVLHCLVSSGGSRQMCSPYYHGEEIE